jgi:hypothetical protein
MVSLIPAGSASASATGTSFDEGSVAEVFLAYRSLHFLAVSLGMPDLAHKLVLCEPLSVAGEAPLIAASIASAASLCIEPDAKMVRLGTRSGAIDFAVNHLDEALRALKNEIRKGMSIAISLEGELQPTLLAMVDRGVQPDVVCLSHADGPALQPFLERGARSVNLGPAQLGEGMLGTTWRVTELPGKWLPLLDEVVASTLPADDFLRRNWLKRAPRYLGRALRTSRYVPMTDSEMRACVKTIETQLGADEWSGLNVHFTRGEAQTTLRSKAKSV